MLKSLIEDRKKLLVIVGVVLAFVLLFVVVLSALSNSLHSKAVGEWKTEETYYFRQYGTQTNRMVKLNADGSAVKLLTNAKTGAILEVERGTWKVSGFRIVVTRETKYGVYPIEYRYDFLADKLKNGEYYYAKIGV